MLSEEEKKVINSLENEYKKLEEKGNILFPLYKQQTKILLNLITKLQKENELLKNIKNKKDYIVGFTIFNSKYNVFKTMYRHFGSLEHAKTFASNVDIKNKCIIYESLDMNEIFKEK